MKITGYKIWKPFIDCSFDSQNEFLKDKNVLLIFLEHFQDLKKEFYSGKDFCIEPTKEHISFLEKLISDRLKIVEKDKSWKENYSPEKINMLKRGQRIIEFNFLNKKYEMNTFGSIYNSTTENLISFYEMLKNSNGLMISTKKEQ